MSDNDHYGREVCNSIVCCDHDSGSLSENLMCVGADEREDEDLLESVLI